MKTFATIVATILIVVSILLGYSCGLESGYDWLAYHVQGWIGAAMFPAVVLLCLAVGNLLGTTPGERRRKPRNSDSQFSEEYWKLVRHIRAKPQVY